MYEWTAQMREMRRLMGYWHTYASRHGAPDYIRVEYHTGSLFLAFLLCELTGMS